VKIIFDQKLSERYGDVNDPDNTPAKLRERREAMLRELGSFCNADSIEYIDQGKGEKYIIRRGKNILTLDVFSTSYDGGWLNIRLS